MVEPRVHRVKGKTVVRTYRILPYSELEEILREDGAAFFEDTKEQRLKRGTIWKAARRLSEKLGKKVQTDRVVLRLENGDGLEGYLFSLAQPQSQSLKDTSS